MPKKNPWSMKEQTKPAWKLPEVLHDDVDLRTPSAIDVEHLGRELSAAMDLSVMDAKETLRVLGSILYAHLVAGRRVMIPFVGRLTIKHSASRNVMNFKTGERKMSPERWRISFHPFPQLRQGVRDAGDRYFARNRKAD